jgi:hypothetical protein
MFPPKKKYQSYLILAVEVAMGVAAAAVMVHGRANQAARIVDLCFAAADVHHCLEMWITKSLETAGNANRLSGNADRAGGCAASTGDTFPVIGGPEVENTMTVGCCSYYYAVN